MEKICDTQELSEEKLDQLEYSKSLKNLLPKGEERNLTKLAKEMHLFNNNKFLMWENDSNICWLDASLALLVHNQTIRCIIKQKPNCQISKIVKGYDKAIAIFNNSIINKNSEERLQIAKNLLKKVQEDSLKYLQPLIKCKRGEPDSAFCSLYNLIKADKFIQSFFNASYAWIRQCKTCGNKNVPTITKPIITIANVDIFVPENHISPCRCYSCEKNDQTIKLVYKKLPPCLIFHFERGAGIGENPPFSFHVLSRKYNLTGIMVLEKGQESNVNHFITYVRDLSNRWLECNDLYENATTFSSHLPSFNLKDIYIYVYEAFDDLGIIEIMEDTLINNSYQNIKCIDISDDSDDHKDVEQNTTSNDNELEENIENITAYLSSSLPATNKSGLLREKYLPSTSNPRTLNCNLNSQEDISICDNVLDIVDETISDKCLPINGDEDRNIQELYSSDANLQKISKSLNRQTKGKDFKRKIDPSNLFVKTNKLNRNLQLNKMNNEKKELKINSFIKNIVAINAKTPSKALKCTMQADDNKSNTCLPIQDVYIPELAKIDSTRLDKKNNVKLTLSEKVCDLSELENNSVYDDKDTKNGNDIKNVESSFINIDQKVLVRKQKNISTGKTAIFSCQGSETETGLDSNCDDKQKPPLILSSFSYAKQHAASTNEHCTNKNISIPTDNSKNRCIDESLLRTQQITLTEIENAKINDFVLEKLSKYKSNKLNVTKVASVCPNETFSQNKTDKDNTDEASKESDSPMLKYPINHLKDSADKYSIEDRRSKDKILQMKILSKKRTKINRKILDKKTCRNMQNLLGVNSVSITENTADKSSENCVDRLTMFAKEKKVISHSVEHKFPNQSKDISYINMQLNSKCVQMNEEADVKKSINSVRNFQNKKYEKSSKGSFSNFIENQPSQSPECSVASTSYKCFPSVPSADNFHNSVKQSEISEPNPLNESMVDTNDHSRKRKLSSAIHQGEKRHAIDTESYSEESEAKIITNRRELKHGKTAHSSSSESSENISTKAGCSKSNCNCKKMKREMVVDGVVDTVLIHLFKVFEINKT